MRRRIPVALATAALTAATLIGAGPVAAEPASETTAAEYEVFDVRSLAQRNAITRTGAAINDMEHSVATVTATGAEVRALRRQGFTVQPVSTVLDFPPA